ncbi:acid phosphatase [Fundidesulfovibrio terrae]|uniref:acid phosphatase n=1 Tax=Fundidesulfovibrio terrae TaxID=2922866 RepID=UPI001FB01D12|nr:phosphatase PAP2 family protein [Fundidesulfovibrio terrae]
MMRPSNRVYLLLFLLLLPQYGWAEETYFVTGSQIDFARLLAPPPAVGSPEERREMAVLMTLQKNRTSAQEAFAQADMERTVFRFADVVGQDFTAEKLPLAREFFEKVRKNADLLLAPAKKHWDRPRPYATNPALHPCVKKPDNASYPSGHSTFGTVTAIVLANMVPEKQAQIFERGVVFGHNREIGGAHYPSDVLAGRICGTVIAAFMLQSPAFQEEFAKARAEVRQVLGLN